MTQLPQTKIQGKLFWKKRWYSICSAHVTYDDTCPRCKVGAWHNVWGIAISGFFAKWFYPFWFYYQNGEFPPKNYKKSLME